MIEAVADTLDHIELYPNTTLSQYLQRGETEEIAQRIVDLFEVYNTGYIDYTLR